MTFRYKLSSTNNDMEVIKFISIFEATYLKLYLPWKNNQKVK
jgi:hypothetical protein